MFQHIKDVVQGKATITQKRSSKWASVRKKFLLTNNTCAACGGKKALEVHHKQPFHKNPELELKETNFVTLCESKENGVNCHLLFGHLGNFKSINVNVDEDVKIWKKKITTRTK